MKRGVRPSSRAGRVQAAVRDLVVANRILANEGILDAFGHVSVRHPLDPSRYLLSRSLAPSLVGRSDILEFDLGSRPVKTPAPPVFLERFIHGEIYKRRPDVNAVVHSHSPTTIPFGVTGAKLRPICHMSGFLHPAAKVFDIRDVDARSDMLIRNNALGAALAARLGTASAALMSGHGNVLVAPDVKLAVYRAVYCEVNARLQIEAAILGGRPRFLSEVEAKKSEAVNIAVLEKPWLYWVQRAGCAHLYAPARRRGLPR